MERKLLEHLKGRPIAPILQQSSEKNNIVALKLMCILDHKLDELKLYKDIAASPKLMKNLLGFKSYADFHYWKYYLPKNFDSKLILQCRHCELIGPYCVTLSHMVLTHGTQIGLKQCNWCNDVDLKEHIETNTVQICYEKYLQNEHIKDTRCPSIISRFYNEIIRKLAEKLGVLTLRSYHFTGEGKQKKDIWDIEPEVLVYRHRPPKPIQRHDILDKLLKNAMTAFYGNDRSEVFRIDLTKDGPSNRVEQPVTHFDSHETIPICTRRRRIGTRFETTISESEFEDMQKTVPIHKTAVKRMRHSHNDKFQAAKKSLPPGNLICKLEESKNTSTSNFENLVSENNLCTIAPPERISEMDG